MGIIETSIVDDSLLLGSYWSGDLYLVSDHLIYLGLLYWGLYW